MKATKKEIPVHTFTPFDLTITVESLEDLKSLWHRMNISPHDIKSIPNYLDGEEFFLEVDLPEVDKTEPVWEILDNELRKLNVI